MSRARTTTTPALARGARGRTGYMWLSMRPLHVLVFLLPTMVLYELGSARYLTDAGHGVVETIGARKVLTDFFNSFGAAGYYLPPVVLGSVLLIWHIFERDKWRVQWTVLLGMLLESVVWMLPILIFGQLVGTHPSVAAIPQSDLAGHTWQAKVTLALGAGIYEESLFRLVLFTAVHFLVVDLLKQKQNVGHIIAACVSALAFTLYHDLSSPSGGLNMGKFFFFLGAGLYFAVLFVMRGLGIVVGTHAFFDILVLVLLTKSG